MAAAFDSHYLLNDRARVAAVLFADFRDAAPVMVLTQMVPIAADYMPGSFFRRELPGILTLIRRIDTPLDALVIDGYVTLGDRTGLGQNLFEALNGRISVIGVAKSRFAGAPAAEVFRGRSRRPLYVTAAGMDLLTAAAHVRSMHGPHRLPTLLQRADHLARGIRCLSR